MQSRCVVASYTGIDLGPVFYHPSHYVAMTFLRGQMQSRPAVFITGVDLGLAFTSLPTGIDINPAAAL